MRPVRIWLSAAVWGLSLTLCIGNGLVLRADEPREREQHAREHLDGDHKDRDNDDRDRRDGDHRDHEKHDRETHKRDSHDHEHADHDHHHKGDHHHDGPTAVRDAVNGELSDVARAFRRIDQSYAYRGMQGCGSCTAGSAYIDWHAKGLCPPRYGYVQPPRPLILGGCGDAAYDDGCSLDRRICTGCGHVHPRGERSGCGCGLNLRPHPPLPNDHQRDESCADRRYSDAEEEFSLLTRRICTGCGHVYPRNEQPRCNCHGGATHHAPHPAPEHRHHDAHEHEPTPVDRDPAPPHLPPRR